MLLLTSFAAATGGGTCAGTVKSATGAAGAAAGSRGGSRIIVIESTNRPVETICVIC